MSSYQFGKAGLTLLGLYVLLETLGSGGSALSRLAETFADTDPTVELVSISIVGLVFSVLLFGALPASILIWNSAKLARRWFANDEQPHSGLSPRHLLQVGVVVLGLATAVSGALGLVTSLSTVVFSRSVEGEAGARLLAMAGGNAVGSVVHLALGLVLVRFAKPLSERWTV